MSGLIVEDLVVRYGNAAAVNGISFTVPDGKFTSLLGPSGCGKTTTLRCIAGLERAASGRIVIGDRVVSDGHDHIRPERRQINMVFQSYAVWPHMTVYNNVAYGLKVRRLPKAEVRERVDAVLDSVGLDGFGHRFGSELSGGQQQRVAMARALVTQPQLILFDEPLSNLDAGLRTRMRDELMEIQSRTGITSLYVTHDQGEAMAMSDQIVLMNSGRIEQVGTPPELYREPRTTFAARFIGSSNSWDATIKTVTHDRLSVVLQNGTPLEVARPAALNVEPGQRGTVVVRAEDVLPVDTAGANHLEVRLTRSVYQGGYLECHAELGPESFRFRLPTDVPAGAHEQLSVYVRPADITWIAEVAP